MKTEKKILNIKLCIKLVKTYNIMKINNLYFLIIKDIVMIWIFVFTPSRKFMTEISMRL